MQTSNKTVYVLGNPILHRDSAPIKLLPALRKTFPHIAFIHIDPTEGFPATIQDPLILLDTVLGITDVTVFSDLEAFTRSPRMTVHDFDLPLELGMMKKLGKLKHVSIIGIPLQEDSGVFLKTIECLIPKILNRPF